MTVHDVIPLYHKEAEIPRKPYTPPYAKIIHTP
jgi:hypothetical protein